MRLKADAICVIKLPESNVVYCVKRLDVRLLIPKLNEPGWNGDLMIPLARPLSTNAGNITHLHMEAKGRYVTVYHLADHYKTSQYTRKEFIRHLREALEIKK